jgi:hypothetical protein
MGLTLSPEKTLVTPVTNTMRFLGHHLRVLAIRARMWALRLKLFSL